MAKKDRQIEFLPAGWQWRSAGQDNQTARHALDPQGNIVSVRQAQKMQRAVRAEQGQPKAQQQRRTGRVWTYKQGGTPGDNTRAGEVGSLYNPTRHGYSESWSFYSLNDARNYIDKYGVPKWADYSIIQVHFTERLVTTTKVGSDEHERNGYASITPYYKPKDLKDFVGTDVPKAGLVDNPWVLAENNIRNYDMSGSAARVYILFQERGNPLA